MKLALLGSDAESLALVRFLAERRDHEIVAIYEPSEEAGELEHLFPAASCSDSWESLLHETTADALIVARGTDAETRAEPLRKLTQAAVPMLVVHPACEAIEGYEIDMIRRDTGCVMVPYHPDALHPALQDVARLAREAASTSIGDITHLVFDRPIVRTDAAAVFAQLARDSLLIRGVLGEIIKLSAMGSTAHDQTYSNFSAQMSSSAGTLATWSISPVDHRLPGRLTLVGTAAQATLEIPGDEREWVLQVADERKSYPGREAGVQAAIQSFTTAVTGHDAGPDWDGACRAIEISEAAQQSRRRGRAVDLYEVEHTEEETFKGLMAAGGCGLLTVGMAVLLIVTVVEGLQLPFRHHLLWRLWPVYLLIPMACFLLLQLLKLVFPRAS